MMNPSVGQDSPPQTGQAIPRATGLTEAEASRRLAQPGHQQPSNGSRSYASIVEANVLTVFNLILAAFGGVTLVFGDARDALFLGIIVANSSIGIFQESRAKRTLDRLSLLVTPCATVQRDGRRRDVPVEQVVRDDLVLLAPGDQVVADGTLLTASDLRLDESNLTGESRPVKRSAGQEIHSGAFVVEGTAAFLVTALGEGSFAAQITGQARSFRHPRSPLERGVNRLLYLMVGLVLTLGAMLGYALYHRHVPARTAVSTATAGVVTLIPEGLMVLVSLTYAAGAVRMSRRGVLAQQLNAIESLASVDTVCIDKTGTLTEKALRVVGLVPAPGASETTLRDALAALGASSSSRNVTLQAIADAYPEQGRTPLAEVPFASRRRWSAVQLPGKTVYLGAPDLIPVGDLSQTAARLQSEGRRVLAAAHGAEPLPESPSDLPPTGLTPLGLAVFAEQLRPNVTDAIAYLREQNITIKVLSGDSPQTVAAIARDVGIPVEVIADGGDTPETPEALREFARTSSVVGRISPHGKQAIVQALREQGSYVAMVGDGVNDVPALKCSQLAIAQGTGTQMARSVADLVLISGDFATVPPLLAEGRRTLRNLQRVAKLYVTKSAFAAFLILTIGLSSDAYPLIPRHLTVAATLTIGIPTFFLALAPSSGPWTSAGFVQAVARFAVPAGFVIGTGVVSAYLFALHDLNLSVPESRTVALTTLIADGLSLVMALEAGGSTRRATLVAVMCAVMAGLYVLTLLMPITKSFFQLTSLTVDMVATSIIASAISIGALVLCGFTVGVDGRGAVPPREGAK